MPTSRVALICIVLSVILAVVCNTRVFYGNGSGSAVFSLDGLFFWGQWSAFVLAVIAMLLSWPHWIGAGHTFSVRALAVPVLSVVMVVYLTATGIPHRANQAAWPNGETGLDPFVRGMVRGAEIRNRENPVAITNAAFAGEWRATDGIVYTFEGTNLIGRAASGGRTVTGSEDCGGMFSIRYVQRDRDVLQDLGFTWSVHANAIYDATPTDAKIPVAEVSCGSDRYVFIRATFNEVWRWTNSLDANAIKSDLFLLTRIK